MNKELIELQRGFKATCVVILDEYYKSLGQTVFMSALMDNYSLFSCSYENPIFKEKLEKLASNGKLTYFVIRGLERLSEEEQNKYLSLVKDREFCGYLLPENVILVFTIESKDNLKKISKELYHFSVVAF